MRIYLSAMKKTDLKFLKYLSAAAAVLIAALIFVSCSENNPAEFLPSFTEEFIESPTPEDTTATSYVTPPITPYEESTETPSLNPSFEITEEPTVVPTEAPTEVPTEAPTANPYENFTVPTIYINTDYGKDITSKEVYVDGTLSDTTGLKDIRCRIRGRGNTTWRDFGKIKPSYRLKIEKKESLGGIGGPEGKDYVLIANYSDLTMLRNYIALNLGGRLSNISYTSEIKFVNLVLNGKDRGLYLLCTKIKIAESRINIESDATGETADTGYLVELDRRADQEDSPYFTIPGTKHKFSVKSDTTSKKQVDFISAAILDLYEKCEKGSREEIKEVLDIDSAADMFILEEFVKDRDVGFASFYILKTAGGKIEFSCPWDFDLSLGNDNDNPTPEGLITEVTNSPDTNPNPFFVYLFSQQWFRKLVYERFTEVKGIIASVIEDYTVMAELLRESNENNDKIYNMYGRKIFKEPKNFYKELLTYDGHIQYLKNWMEERLIFMENYLKEKAGP